MREEKTLHLRYLQIARGAYRQSLVASANFRNNALDAVVWHKTVIRA